MHFPPTLKHRRWVAIAIASLFSLLLTLYFPTTATAQTNAPATVPPTAPATEVTELRGVWLTNIDSDVLFSKAKLKAGIARLKRMNFNTIYPVVLNGGYTLYPSKVAQAVVGTALDPEPRLKNRDMLAEAVAEGHQQGLAVIPWLEFGLMLPGDTALAQSHPEWIAQRADGSEVWLEGGRIERRWLSPFHPQVRQFLTAIVAEIAANYDVDGIQFDDHLGLPVAFGYDAYTVKLYQQEHNGKRPPTQENDPEWVRWRADKITELTAQLFHTVKAIKPKCVFSMSPNPQEYAYATYLQDWSRWQNLGYLEEVIVQVYRNDLPRFVSELRHPTVQRSNRRISTNIGILAGLKSRDVPMKQIVEQVETVRKEGLGGVSFFFYETLGNRDRQFTQLFAKPARRAAVL